MTVLYKKFMLWGTNLKDQDVNLLALNMRVCKASDFKIIKLEGNSENALLVKSIDVLGFLEKMDEEWVVEIEESDKKPCLFLLGVPDIHLQESLQNVFGRIPTFLVIFLHKTYTTT